MNTLASYVEGRFHEATTGFATLVNPCTEAEIARVSSEGVDFGAALEHARRRGRPALDELSFAERGALLAAMAKALHAHRDELIALSLQNTGATRKDAKFDIDGGTFTLSHYAAIGEALGDRRYLVDGDGVRLGSSARFWGQHVRVPFDGVAVHINAFNFPVWGFAEKASCAILAGMPVISKPATSTAVPAARCVQILAEAGVLPDGVFSMVVGRTGDLLDRLGEQDVLAFTGSASTAMSLRGKTNLLERSTHVNIEADSLNAAVLAPGLQPDDETWQVFLRDVVREMTQKTGQKCTAVRRIFVPAESMDAVQEALVASLHETVVGDPADGSVNMGPLATAQQLEDAIAGVKLLSAEATLVLGAAERIDGVGAPSGMGYFFAPALLRMDDATSADAVHRHEVFGPVATLVAYDGTAAEAGRLVARGAGSLVTSLYADDKTFIADFLRRCGSTTGRLYLGSEKVAASLPGSGLAMPALMHGGPGRAGGGTELGSERGLELYTQRVAVSGDRGIIERMLGIRD